jgi:hypothetical protein
LAAVSRIGTENEVHLRGLASESRAGRHSDDSAAPPRYLAVGALVLMLTAPFA